MLRTERTTIHRITIEDAPFFLELVNSDPWVRFIGDRGVGSVEDAETYLRNGFLKSYEENGFGYYLIRTNDEQPIGTVGFLKKPNLENPDFGFALIPEAFGKGYGIEAAQAVLDWGVEEFDFDVLDAVTVSANVSSKRLLEKLGFSFLRMKDKELELYRWKNRKTSYA